MVNIKLFFKNIFLNSHEGDQLELNTPIYNITLYINCVYASFDMSAFVDIKTSFHCLIMGQVEMVCYYKEFDKHFPEKFP